MAQPTDARDHVDERAFVVVRGGEGSVGRAVSEALLAAGYRVGDTPEPGAAALVDTMAGDYDLVAASGVSPAVEVAKSIDLAHAHKIDHVVVLSSAMVYGAQPNNPIPLTEDAVLRPSPDFVYARQLAAAEQLVDQWRRDGARRAAAVLRPAVPVDAHGSSSLARALTFGLGQRFDQADSPGQFVHVDDVATAVVLAVQQRLDGVFNVAPDGWIAGDRLRALTGNRFRFPLPDRLAEVVSSLRWRFQRGPIPPGLQPYVERPWVVANDKLRHRGWRPTVTNEQAFVEGTEAPWWTMITPQRRQEIALGAMAAAFVAALAGAAALFASLKRRR